MTTIAYYQSYMDEALKNLLPSFGEIIVSKAFQRLRKITFLGILSHTYKKNNTEPLFRPLIMNLKEHNTTYPDQTRFEHSINVANLSFLISKHLALSQYATNHFVSWGLIHDMAAWPLSHTGEVAFSEITNVSSNELRRKIILSDKSIPNWLGLKQTLINCDVDPKQLLKLLNKKENNTTTPDMSIVWQIIHSRLTPDTLEGIWRSCCHFGVKESIIPNEMVECFDREGSIAQFNTKMINKIFIFWNNKSYVYSNIINDTEIVRWESACSSFLRNQYVDVSLEESLSLSEKDLANQLLKHIGKQSGVFRYKPPLKYKMKRQIPKYIIDKHLLLDLNKILYTIEKDFRL